MSTQVNNGVRIYYSCEQRKANGELVVRVVDIQPPAPPQCLAFKCLYQFMRDSLFCALLVSYHRRRVEYATRNRDKKILERYRTGNPAPKTIWQAVHANIKLKCPICRRYNVDPLLFDKTYRNIN